MKKYKKASELEVLQAFNDIEIIGQYFIPKFLVADHLKTSQYQVSKCCNNLIEKGFMRKSRCEPFHDIEYESGIDYGNSLSIWTYDITDEGVKKLKEENLYNKKWYETI